MVRTKVNRFTLSSDTTKVVGNRSEIQAAMDARRNIRTALENERLTTASNGMTARSMQLKATALNPNKSEREPIITFRKKFYRKEPESGQLKEQHQDQHPLQFIHQGPISELPRKQYNSFDDTIKKASSEMSIEFPPKTLLKKRNGKGNVSHRSKQKYYIIDEHGDSTQINQAKAFSNESLECMEIMKAAIRDVVHEKISQITGIKFQTINERLDEMLEMIKKNEIAIEECSKELRGKLKHYGEDTSRHLKYLCMKLEYEKLMSQNINTFLASDLTRHVGNNISGSSCQNKNNHCGHQSHQNCCRRCSTVQACCCCSYNKTQQHIHRKCNSDDCVATSSSQQKTNVEKTARSVKNAQSNTSATSASLESAIQVENDKPDEKSLNESGNISIPQILNNFLRYKLNSGKYPMSTNATVHNCNDENIPGTSTFVSCGNNSCNNNMGTQNNNGGGTGSNDIRLRDILDSIEKYYPISDRETTDDIKLENYKSEINLKENDDDQEECQTSEGTVEEEESDDCKNSVNESDNNYCNNIDDCNCATNDEA